MPLGRTLISTAIVVPTRVSADAIPSYKVGGVTIDLTTIPAASGSDVTLPDGSIIRANSQYLRYGQILTRIGVSQVQTITISGSTNAGDTFTITVPAYGTGDSPQTTTSLAYNATAVQVAAALQVLPKVGPNGVAVSLSGSVWTITFSRLLGVTGGLPQLTTTYTQVGGSTGALATAIATSAGNSNKVGPYDPTASDGRAVISRGNAWILDELWLYYPAGATFAGLGSPDMIGNVIESGLVYLDRVLMAVPVTGNTASLANGPTQSDVEAAFPTLRWLTGH